MHRPGVGRRMAATITAILVLALLGPLAAVSADTGQPQQVPSREIILVLDGSSSVDSNEWRTLLRGYSWTILDPAIVPQNSTVSVGVVQYSGPDQATGTRLEIPLTTITSTTVANDLATQITQIQQLGSVTNTGDGILTATEHLQSDGHTTADWSLCVSPEGIVNSGTFMTDAYDAAETAGVGKIGYLALQDTDGGFDEPQARSAYGPYVLGGGDVQMADSAVMLSELALGCFQPPVELRAIEVNQAVQDWNNSVPLIEDKDTIVRVFAEHSGAGTVKTTGRLRGYRNGQELPESPLLHTQEPRAITVDSSAALGRETLAGSLNFRLPKSWTTGTIELVPELPVGLECDPTDPRWTADCGVQATFQDTGTMRILLQGTSWEDANGNRQTVAHDELIEQYHRIKDLFPAGKFDVLYGETLNIEQIDGSPDAMSDTLNTLHSMWEQLHFWAGMDARVKYYLAMPGQPAGTDPWYGIAHTPGRVGTWFVSGLGNRNDTGYNRNIGGHESMHTYGREHTVRTVTSGDPMRGMCGEHDEAVDSVPEYPYWFIPPGLGLERPALGPMGTGTDHEVWGATPRYFSRSGSQEALAITDPNVTFSLMSYCNPTTTASQGRWVDQDAYTDLATSGFDTFPAATGQQEVAQVDAESTLIGVIDLDQQTARLDPAHPAFGIPATGDDSNGTHTLQLIGTDDQVLHSVRFTPSTSSRESDTTRLGSFVINVPAIVEQAERAEVIYDGQVIGSIATGPEATEALRVENIHARAINYSRDLEVTWDGGTVTGDQQPVYTVQYSADDGTTWDTIGRDLTDTHMTVDRWALPGSTQARIRILTSYGLATSQTTSQPYTMPVAVPQLTVDHPDDLPTYTGTHPIHITATAYDAQDGNLTGDTITWESDLDGPLATGTTLTTRADHLTEGIHLITVQATASTGQTTGTTFLINIQHRPDLGE